MRSQYILIFLILILSMFLYYIDNLQNYYFYNFDINKYLAEDFKIKLYLYDKNVVNSTYSNLCLEYGRQCYYNGTHIIIIFEDEIISYLV